MHANLAAVRLVLRLEREGRAATAGEQEVLARWSGWGAVPEVFETRARFAGQWGAEQGELRDLLGEEGYNAARATILNAHYTDPAVVAEMWRALQRAGIPDGALMVEPGCGSGNFIGAAPAHVGMVGVEVEPVSAKIAHHLYPSAQIRHHGFERPFAGDGAFSGAIGNVPFARTGVYDPIHNAEGFSLHNQFIVKSLALTAPGGYVAVITSAHTSDAVRVEARQRITGLGDLVGAVRLPSSAFARQAKTDVVTDLLVFRRREDGRDPTPDTALWASPVEKTNLPHTGGADGAYRINPYFLSHPGHVLGDLRIGNGLNGRDGLAVTPDDSAPLAVQLRSRLDPVIDNAAAAGLGFTAAPTPSSRSGELRAPGLVTAAEETAGVDVLPGALRWVGGGFEQFTVGSGWQGVTCKGEAKQEQWRLLTDMGQAILDLTEASSNPRSKLADRDQLRARLNTLYDTYSSRFGPVNRFKLESVREPDEAGIARALEAKIAAWRVNAGRAEARERGLDPEQAAPYEGDVPADVEAALRDEAAAARPPRQVRSHLQGAIARDPRLGMVLAAEDFTANHDGTGAAAAKGAIFTEDVTPFTVRASSAATAGEAAAVAFDETGRIVPERMAELLGLSVEDTLAAAKGAIYPSLHSDTEYELAATFLSGHIRDKLALARVRATQDPARYDGVVDALEQVVPPEVDPADITVRPGAGWIPLDDYRAFLLAEFKLDPARLAAEKSELTGAWHFATSQDNRHADRLRGHADAYGSARLSGVEMFNLIANNKPIAIPKTEEELEASPTPAHHPQLTAAARAAAMQLQQRFAAWLWSDGDRYLRLKQRFNEKHNSFVKPVHNADHKTFPGLNPKYRPYRYQAAAVQRYLTSETILLDHVVGAGKTLTVTIAAMEAKRLGQVRQPWVVVPNHLLGQWAQETRDAYPAARILVAADLDGVGDRQRFIGQTASGDWDMVIVPQSVFTLIGMKREAQIEYLQEEVAQMRQALEAANEQGADFSAKAIERSIRAAEERVEKMIRQTRSDNGLTFEQSGCDSLWVDEAHEYKNLTRPANAADLAVPLGSQRASDLEMKARWLRAEGKRRNTDAGRPGAPVKAVAFATGTPVSNSLSEMWVMTKFLRPDLLDEAGMGRIDNWAGTFAEPVTRAEMNITGTRLRMVSRMSRYSNVPQLVSMIDQFRDVVTRDQIPVRLPQIEGGRAQTLEFDLPQEVLDFMADLDDRLADLGQTHPDTGEAITPAWDNTLKIATDGRNATMHPRLAGLASPPPGKSRVDAAADYLARVHTENAEQVTPADKYGPQVRGVFQLVFCDRGTPKPGDGPRARNVYTELRDALAARGVPREQVAFLHEAKTAKAKVAMIEACNDGRIRFLLTSTKKGGTGLNAQRLLKTVMNMDAAWTAADMEQRIGRGIRQGNTNTTVNIVNLVARRSYDATMYQVVERKAAAVGQIRTQDAPPTMEDISADMTLSWAQTKAAATGDPVYVQQVEADQQVEILEGRRKAAENANQARAASIRALQRAISASEEQLPVLRTTAGQLAGWVGEDRGRRHWRIGGKSVADSDTAGLVAALRGELADLVRDTRALGIAPVVAEIAADSPYTLSYTAATGMYGLSLHGAARYLDRDKLADVLGKDSAAHGLLKTMRNMAAEVPNRVGDLERQLAGNRAKLAQAVAEPEAVFADEELLEQAKVRARELRLEVNSRENSPEAMSHRRRDIERRRSQGQYRGWTRDLNPTEMWAAEARKTTVSALVASVPKRMEQAKAAWEAAAPEREQKERANPWQALDDSGHELRYGHDPGSGQPGARVHWRARQWHWQAWDGNTGRASGAANEQPAATRSAAASLDKMLAANGQTLGRGDLEREAARRHAARTTPDGQEPAPVGQSVLNGLRATARTRPGNTPKLVPAQPARLPETPAHTRSAAAPARQSGYSITD